MMLTFTDFSFFVKKRFWENFFPIPAISTLELGLTPLDFELPDITNDTTVRLSDYRDKQPVILAFTRIFTEKLYCPLCYPHIKELNENYERLTGTGAQLLMITSTDPQQTQQVVQDLGLKMPLLSDPSCKIFQAYEVGQALGAPLPAQFILDREGKLRYTHLFSFLSPNAGSDKLLEVLERM